MDERYHNKHEPSFVDKCLQAIYFSTSSIEERRATCLWDLVVVMLCVLLTDVLSDDDLVQFIKSASVIVLVCSLTVAIVSSHSFDDDDDWF